MTTTIGLFTLVFLAINITFKIDDIYLYLYHVKKSILNRAILLLLKQRYIYQVL